MDCLIEQEADSSTGWLQPFLELGHTDPDSSHLDLDETTGYDDTTAEIHKTASSTSRICKRSRPHSTPLTLKWLQENYETAEGVCIPRSTLYLHYLDFCEAHDTTPVNAASFGKIIRQQFPLITTRRLGTRGQSKYHYYGIAVRDSSVYYEVIYSAKASTTASDCKKELPKQVVTPSPRSKLGTLLPDFPDVTQIVLPDGIEESKVVTFLMMYRTHCQRLLDTVIRASFEEVQTFLLHFWQGVPSHLTSILASDVMVKVIGVCDSILYKTIAGVLMPSVLQALPDSLTQVIRRFGRQLEDWLTAALQGLPQVLTDMKLDLARRFCQVVKRQISLNHLVQASRTVVSCQEMVTQLLTDWLGIDLGSVLRQTLYTTMDQGRQDTMSSSKENQAISHMCTEFEKLLEDQAPVKSYIEWLDRMVNRCVVKTSATKPGSLRSVARQFLLMWSCFGTRLVRDMTLHNAPSFGSFHLLHLMFDDYVLYKVESLHAEERIKELLRVLKGEKLEGDPDPALPDPTLASQSVLASPWSPGGLSTRDTTGYDSSRHPADQGLHPLGFHSNTINGSCSVGDEDTMFDCDIDSDELYSSPDEDSLEDSPPPLAPPLAPPLVPPPSATSPSQSHHGLTTVGQQALGTSSCFGVPPTSGLTSSGSGFINQATCLRMARRPEIAQNRLRPDGTSRGHSSHQPLQHPHLYYSAQQHHHHHHQLRGTEHHQHPQHQQPHRDHHHYSGNNNNITTDSAYHQQMLIPHQQQSQHHPQLSRLQQPSQCIGPSCSFQMVPTIPQHQFPSDQTRSCDVKQIFVPHLPWSSAPNTLENTQFGNMSSAQKWTLHDSSPSCAVTVSDNSNNPPQFPLTNTIHKPDSSTTHVTQAWPTRTTNMTLTPQT